VGIWFPDNFNNRYSASFTYASEPLTLACWFTNSSNLTSQRGLIRVGDNGLANTWILNLNYGGAWTMNAYSRNSVGGIGAATTSAISSMSSTGTVWRHAAAVFTTSSSRAAYMSGVAKATNGSAITVSPASPQLFIGSGDTTSLSHAGAIAHATVWAAALNDGEIAALQGGAHPMQVRPESIVFWNPLDISGLTASRLAVVNQAPSGRYPVVLSQASSVPPIFTPGPPVRSWSPFVRTVLGKPASAARASSLMLTGMGA